MHIPEKPKNSFLIRYDPTWHLTEGAVASLRLRILLHFLRVIGVDLGCTVPMALHRYFGEYTRRGGWKLLPDTKIITADVVTLTETSDRWRWPCKLLLEPHAAVYVVFE